MEINTKDFGIIEVKDDAIYQFPEGIYGFEEDKTFAVFENAFDDLSLLYLQSVQHSSPSFLVFDPWDFCPDYQPDLPKEELEVFGVETIKDLIFLVIANVPSAIRELSINIKSPIVLNPKTRIGKQFILQNPDYTVRYRPFLQERKAGL